MQSAALPSTTPLSTEDLATIDGVLARHAGQRGTLLPILHELQDNLGYVPDAAVPAIALALNVSRAEVHGVLTFYHDFRRAPAGKHVVKLCRAEACQARGSAALESVAEEKFGVGMNATREDGQVTLEAIYCLGLCAIGPNVLVDGRPIAAIDASKLGKIAQEIAA